MSSHFFIIGAQRSATTYLYQMLAAHPEIEMAKPSYPEPKFFLRDDLFTRGLDFYATHFFSDNSLSKLKGEKSTSYLEYEIVAQRLAKCYPNAKLIVLMRDPIARAISNYWFSQNNGLETWSLEKALFADPGERISNRSNSISVNPFAYLQRGRYINFIKVYDKYFPTSQIFGILTEELLGNLEKLQAVYAYLGVSSNFQPKEIHQRFNESIKSDIDALSPKLRHNLNEYFFETNNRLADRFNFDLARWWPSCQ